jgi:rsbT co-antagonist protein RsbR
MTSAETRLSDLFGEIRAEVLTDWIAGLRQDGYFAQGRIGEAEATGQARELLELLGAALRDGGSDTSSSPYQRARDFIAEISRARALQGFLPTETAGFFFSVKRPLFQALRKRLSAEDYVAASEAATLIVDRLGLFSMESYQQTREQVIIRQQREIAELSTPVVKLWDGVLALPLIGTLDSERTQVVMENLLQSIVDNSAEIAIIDITGVPTVDTLVAQHLLKTVAAARLMGADCIVSGIRPQIAQTMVHLGVELNVVSKATLADAFQVALTRIGRTVVSVKSAAAIAAAAR